MSGAVDPLSVTVGTECNIRCRHCLVDSHLGSRVIAREEISALASEIKRHSPGTLLFTGGEPTLFIPEIQAILSELGAVVPKNIILVTNGSFAINTEEALRVLKSIPGLSCVAVSHDKYHAEFVPREKIALLLQVCGDLGIKSRIMFALEDPLELTFISGLTRPGVQVALQQILPMGRAGANKLEYRYSSFDPGALLKKCPNLGAMVYNCGSGYTVCCGPLASCADKNPYVHRTIAEHLGSRFYRALSAYTFGELAEAAGVKSGEFSPEHSMVCRLCAAVMPKFLEADNLI